MKQTNENRSSGPKRVVRMVLNSSPSSASLYNWTFIQNCSLILHNTGWSLDSPGSGKGIPIFPAVIHIILTTGKSHTSSYLLSI